MQGFKFTRITERTCSLEGIPEPLGYAIVGTLECGNAVFEYSLNELDGGFPVIYSTRDQARIAANNLVGEVVDLEMWELINVGEDNAQTNN
jgi:hypothetical protein